MLNKTITCDKYFKLFYMKNTHSIVEFCFKMVEHIGEQIKSVLEKKGLSVTEFAKRINKSRENCYSILSRKTIDTGLLVKISSVLEYDFFDQFSTKSQSNTVLIEQMREDIRMLKHYNALLKNTVQEDNL